MIQDTYVNIVIHLCVATVAGALIGSRMAIRHGSGFVRYLYIAVVSLLICKFCWDLARP